MPALEGIEEVIQTTCGIISIALNLFLLHLIINKSPPKFGVYKYLMIYTSVLEIAYAIVDMLLTPHLFSYRSAYLVIVDSNKTILPSWIIFYFNIFYSVAFGMAIGIFDIHFVFRYLVVTGKTSWTSKSPFKLLVWIAIPLTCGLLASVVCHVFLGPNELMNSYIQNDLANFLQVSMQYDYYIGFYIYPTDSTGTQVVNWWNIIGLVLTSLILGTTSFVMFFFGIKCYKAISSLTSKTSNISMQSQSVQTQLFYALVVQTVIPMALMQLPALVLFAFCFADSAFEAIGRFLSVTIAMYPAINPLPNMFIITDYRRAIMGLFSKQPKRSSQLDTMASTTIAF